MNKFKHGELVWYCATEIRVITIAGGNVLLLTPMDYAEVTANTPHTSDLLSDDAMLRRCLALECCNRVANLVRGFADENKIISTGFSICKI